MASGATFRADSRMWRHPWFANSLDSPRAWPHRRAPLRAQALCCTGNPRSTALATRLTCSAASCGLRLPPVGRRLVSTAPRKQVHKQHLVGFAHDVRMVADAASPASCHQPRPCRARWYMCPALPRAHTVPLHRMRLMRSFQTQYVNTAWASAVVVCCTGALPHVEQLAQS